MTLTYTMLIEAIVGLIGIFGALYKGVDYIAMKRAEPIKADQVVLRGDVEELKEAISGVQQHVTNLDSDQQVMQNQIKDLLEQMKIETAETAETRKSLNELTKVITALVNNLKPKDLTIL